MITLLASTMAHCHDRAKRTLAGADKYRSAFSLPLPQEEFRQPVDAGLDRGFVQPGIGASASVT
jgi:hypothetical protein